MAQALLCMELRPEDVDMTKFGRDIESVAKCPLFSPMVAEVSNGTVAGSINFDGEDYQLIARLVSATEDNGLKLPESLASWSSKVFTFDLPKILAPGLDVMNDSRVGSIGSASDTNLKRLMEAEVLKL
jgi:hypothetical protein